MAWFASLLLYLAKLSNYTQGMGQRILHHFKDEYHRRAAKAPRGETVPLFLPMHDVFLAKRPERFRQVFPVEQPCPPKIDFAHCGPPIGAAPTQRE